MKDDGKMMQREFSSKRKNDIALSREPVVDFSPHDDTRDLPIVPLPNSNERSRVGP